MATPPKEYLRDLVFSIKNTLIERRRDCYAKLIQDAQELLLWCRAHESELSVKEIKSLQTQMKRLERALA